MPKLSVLSSPTRSPSAGHDPEEIDDPGWSLSNSIFHEGVPIWFSYSFKLEPDRAELTRALFEDVKTKGWKVDEVMYDRRCQYPVKAGEACVNGRLCKWRRERDEQKRPFRDPEGCFGNVEEVLAHEGEWQEDDDDDDDERGADINE